MGPEDELDRWAMGVLRRSSPWTGRLVTTLCPPPGRRAFRLLYAAFRVIDDRVDAPAPDPALGRWATEVEAALTGAPGDRPELRALAALRLGPLGEELAPAISGMWAAQRFDLGRRREPGPRARAELEAQRARIGDSYLLAVWVCFGQPGAPPDALNTLARAATGLHWLRDREEDQRLGYDNRPAEEPAEGWEARWGGALRRELALGRGALRWRGLPWRMRVALALLAWRYGRRLRARGEG